MIDKAEAPIHEAFLPGVFKFDSREAYEKVHGAGSLPPFDPTQDRRYWFHPAAKSSPKLRVEYKGIYVDESDYPVVEDGAVVLETFTVHRDVASAPPNIPGEMDDLQLKVRPYLRILPVPLRPMEGDEYLACPAFMGRSPVVVVRRRALWEAELQKDPVIRTMTTVTEILATLKRWEKAGGFPKP